MLARKSVMVKWIGADSPSVQLWLIPVVVVLERLRYYINGRNHLFITKLKSTVELFEIKCILDLACKFSRTCFQKLKFHKFIYFSLDFILIMQLQSAPQYQFNTWNQLQTFYLLHSYSNEGISSQLFYFKSIVVDNRDKMTLKMCHSPNNYKIYSAVICFIHCVLSSSCN